MNNRKELWVVGLMLFALFFGAGNLIFPPLLGMESGRSFWPAIIGFIITGVGLPIIAVAAIALSKNGVLSIAEKVHPRFALLFAIVIYLVIGPFFAIPRGANVAFEMGVKPFLSNHSGSFSLFLFSMIFFIMILWLSINPTKMVDRVGELLTPLLLASIAVLCVTGFLKLNGSIQPPSAEFSHAPLAKGFLEGYLTMDAIAGLAFGTVVINALQERGIENGKKMVTMTIKAGIIAGSGLAIVYIGTGYIGVKMASQGSFENGGEILSSAASLLFGAGGKVLLGIIVALAVLTTCIGLVVACAQFFSERFPAVSYKGFVVLITIISFVIANMGLNQIISISVPILSMLYPLAIVLIVLSFIDHYSKGITRRVYQGAIFFTAIFSLYDGLKAFGLKWEWLDHTLSWIPLISVGLGWLLPSILGGIIGWAVSSFRTEKNWTPAKMKQ
jgi:LIVCS family branched-chain amino acid:cation transporter